MEWVMGSVTDSGNENLYSYYQTKNSFAAHLSSCLIGTMDTIYHSDIVLILKNRINFKKLNLHTEMAICMHVQHFLVLQTVEYFFQVRVLDLTDASLFQIEYALQKSKRQQMIVKN
jgi:hypothetical protein